MPKHTPRPRHQPGTPSFPGRNYRYERCEDCELEGRLNIVGQPIFVKDIGIQKTLGCETCGGTGHMPRLGTIDGVGLDPYEIPKR